MKPFLILHEPEIPFNVGSLIRLSACFQTKLAIIRPCGFPWDITRIKRAVMDYYDKCEIIFYNSFQKVKATHQGRILSTQDSYKLNTQQCNRDDKKSTHLLSEIFYQPKPKNHSIYKQVKRSISQPIKT